MMNKIKTISFYITCVTMLIGAIFGVFRMYDKVKGKVNQVNSNTEKATELKANYEDAMKRIKKLELRIKKMRMKSNGAEKILKEEIAEEEEKLKKSRRRKRVLGIF